VVWIVAGLTAVAVLIALRLDASADPGAFFDEDSSVAKATRQLDREFGDEPIVVMIRNRKAGCPGGRNCRLTDLLLTPDLIRVLSFEGCVSGNVPPRAKPPAPVCEEFTRKKPFEAVSGPGTFINESARQISARIKSEQRQGAATARRAAEAARKIGTARGLTESKKRELEQQARALAQLNALQPALRYGLSPRGAGIGDPSFVHQLVFDPSISFDAPKTRFAQFFPSRRSAVIELRPRSDLDAAGRREAIGLVRKAVASPSFQLKSSRYILTGEPVVGAKVASGISHSLLILLIATSVIAIGVLAFVLRTRRFWPLLPAGVTVALTFGLMSLLGITLTLASIAVLPVLAGIAAGTALRFQQAGELPLVAVAAGLIGFLALGLSPVPMVRTFGVFVAIGIVLSVFVALTLGSALLRGGLRMPLHLPARGAPRLANVFDRVGNAVSRLIPVRAWQRLNAVILRRPGRVLGIAVAVAIIGWVLGPQLEVVSQPSQLAPGDSAEMRDLDQLTQEGGVDRGLSVLVTGSDLTEPRALSWMVGYQRKVSAQHGYSEERPCRLAELCPAVSLVDLFGAGRLRSRAQARTLLESLPSYFTKSVISRDRRTANITFLVRRMPLDKRRELIDDMRRGLDPPPGVNAEIAGPPALVADTGAQLESNGRMLALLALLVVFLLLLGLSIRRAGAFDRAVESVTVLLIPVALATGWSFLVMVVLGTTLNPLSAALGALVVGVCAYAAIEQSAAYRDVRAGRSPGETSASEVSAARPRERRAQLQAFAAIAIAGFGALVFSDVPMLREFGAVASVDFVVLLTAVTLVLPATVVWAERRGPLKLPRSRAEWRAIGRAAFVAARSGAAYAWRRLRRLPAAARSAPRRIRRLPALVARLWRSRPLRRRDQAQRP
jgi:predicted RND superfamily exporter protein